MRRVGQEGWGKKGITRTAEQNSEMRSIAQDVWGEKGVV